MIVVFDAQCLLCSRWVAFLLKHDRLGRYQFASIQGSVGQRLLEEAGLRVEGLDTLLLVDGLVTWRHTTAIIYVLSGLGGPWRLVRLALLIPAPLRDPLYRFIARRRYAFFGQTSVCLRPEPQHLHRFLD